MKNYVFYTNFMRDAFTFETPNTEDRVFKTWRWKITFQETIYWPVENQDDMRMIGIVEYDESIIDEEVLQAFYRQMSMFVMMPVTEEKINNFLQKYYPEVSVSNFIFTDNRNLERD